MRKSAVGLVLLSLAAALSAAPLSSANPELSLVSVTWLKRPTRVGDVGVVRVALAAYGEEVLLNSRAFFSSGGCAQIFGSSAFELGALHPGAAKTVDLTLNFTGTCSYTLSIAVTYSSKAKQVASGYRVESESGSATLQLRLSPVFEPQLSIAVSPSSLSPGTANRVSLSVANVGAVSVHSVKVLVAASGAVLSSAKSSAELEVGALRPGEVAVHELTLTPLSSVATLSVKLSFVDESGQYGERAESFAMPVTSQAVVVTLSPQAIPAMSSSRSTLAIRNLGGEPMLNATLYLSVQQGSSLVVEPSAVRVGDVAPGEEVSVPLTFRAPYGERGARAVTYTLVYRSGDGSLRVLRDAFTLVLVEGVEVLVTAVDAVPSEPSAGSTVLLSATLMGLGSSPVFGVNVSLLAPPELRPLRGTYYYIGQLSPYTPTAVPFSLTASREGVYTVRIVVVYRDYYGELKTSVRELTLTVRAPASGNSGGEVGARGARWLPAAVALVAALAGVLVLARRRVRGAR